MSAVSDLPEQLLLELSDDGTPRILHPLRVTSVRNGVHTAVCSTIPAAGEGDVGTIYFSLQRRFLKQPVQITEFLKGRERSVIRLQPLGQPASAEQRTVYRVSSVGSDIEATVQDETGCTVVDVSATGLGVYAEQTLEVGDEVTVTLHYEGVSHPGVMTVQSIRRVGYEARRYGLFLVDDGQELVRALPKVSLAVQREQMRRLQGH